MKKVGIIGYTGMVGSEIERRVQRHNLVDIVLKQNKGNEDDNFNNCDLVIFATPTEASLKRVPKALEQRVRVIDTSGAFRLKNLADFEKWYEMAHTCPWLLEEAVYGLPAFYKEKIKDARLVVIPGCYPTGALLALKPLEGMLQGIVRIYATEGISGAGKLVKPYSNERTYSAFEEHRHVPEMKQYSGFDIFFVPTVLESVERGINMQIEAELSKKLKHLSDEEAEMLIASKIRQAYSPEDLVEVTTGKRYEIGTYDVNYTHKAIISVHAYKGYVLLISRIDNLLRGSASQVVENMNLMFGFSPLHGMDALIKQQLS